MVRTNRKAQKQAEKRGERIIYEKDYARNLASKPANIMYFLAWITESRKEASGTSLCKSTAEQNYKRVQTLDTNTMNGGQLPRHINLQIHAVSNRSRSRLRNCARRTILFCTVYPCTLHIYYNPLRYVAVFSDSQAAIRRTAHLEPGPGQ